LAQKLRKEGEMERIAGIIVILAMVFLFSVTTLATDFLLDTKLEKINQQIQEARTLFKSHERAFLNFHHEWLKRKADIESAQEFRERVKKEIISQGRRPEDDQNWIKAESPWQKQLKDFKEFDKEYRDIRKKRVLIYLNFIKLILNLEKQKAECLKKKKSRAGTLIET